MNTEMSYNMKKYKTGSGINYLSMLILIYTDTGHRDVCSCVSLSAHMCIIFQYNDQGKELSLSIYRVYVFIVMWFYNILRLGFVYFTLHNIPACTSLTRVNKLSDFRHSFCV